MFLTSEGAKVALKPYRRAAMCLSNSAPEKAHVTDDAVSTWMKQRVGVMRERGAAQSGTQQQNRRLCHGTFDKSGAL